jgi:tetratricopeptide (TPR) repeat protein
LEAINNLAGVRYAQDRLAEAADLFREVFEGCQHSLSDDDPLTLKVGNNLAHCLTKLGRLQEAEAILDFVVTQADIVLADDDFDAAIFHGNYGECLAKLGRCREAQRHLDAAYQTLNKRVGPEHDATRKAVLRLAEFHETCGDPAQAAAFRSLLTSADATGGKK